MMNLGKIIEISEGSNDRLLNVSCINLLNKLIKSMNKPVKEAYYGFLLQSLGKVSDF